MPAFGIQYKLGVDGISLALVVLTTTLTWISILASFTPIVVAREGVHDLLPDPRGGHDRRLPGARHVPLLHLLGARADPDVPDHRHLGRREPDLRDDQVRPLHAGRLAADARRDPGQRLYLPGRHGHLGGRIRLRSAARLRLRPDAPVLRLRRLLPRLRDQGADVPVPHLAARRARRGADRRLGDPRRRAAQARRLRPAALRRAALPRRGRRRGRR